MSQISNTNSVSSQSKSITVDLTTEPDTANTKEIVASAVRPASYVWLHFVKLQKCNINKCGVIKADGSKCGAEMKRDETGSTKSMKNHLESKHGIRDANLPNQSDILASFKKIKTDHMVRCWSISLSLLFPSFSYLSDSSNIITYTFVNQA